MMADPTGRPVTRWDRWSDKAGAWELNHIEDGHVSGTSPEPRFPAQRSWVTATWRRSYGYLVDGVVRLAEHDNTPRAEG